MSDSKPPAVGIDLGTTYSVVASLDEDGRPQTIVNAEGDTTTPSVVLFDESGPIVGKEAVKAATLEPDRVASFAKRDMGMPSYTGILAGEKLPPEVIQAIVLKKLREDAEAMIGPFDKCVVTVPAYFNEPCRKATQDSGRLAGLDVIDIINEPTAAAIAYGIKHGFLSAEGKAHETERVLVYDLGGGTFDVTLMEIDGKHYNTVATAGDAHLGGIDWDSRLIDFIAEKFIEKYDVDPREDVTGSRRLAKEAEDAKRALTARPEFTIGFEHHGQGLRVRVTREEFETMSADLLERTRFTCNQMLREAGLGWPDVTRVLLVGGSTRMPMIRQMLENESHRPLDRSLSVDEAVSHGAAIYASILLAMSAGERPTFSVNNVNSHNLGVLGIEPATGMTRNRVLIPRNTRLPAKRSSRFSTQRKNQRSVLVPVVEGGDLSGNNATEIGKCLVLDLPANLEKGTPIKVTFRYAANGRLEVQASLPDVERVEKTVIERASGLDDEAVEYWAGRIAEGFILEIPEVEEEAEEDQDVPELHDAPAIVTDAETEEVEEEAEDEEVDFESEEELEDEMDASGHLLPDEAEDEEEDEEEYEEGEYEEDEEAEVDEAEVDEAETDEAAEEEAVEEEAAEAEAEEEPAASAEFDFLEGGDDEEEEAESDVFQPPMQFEPPTIVTDDAEESPAAEDDDDALGDFLKGLG